MEGGAVDPAMQATKAKLTYKDYEQFPDDGQRHELIDGEHVVTPAPELGHQQVLRRLFLAVNGAVEAGPGGELIFAPMDVILSDHDVLQPDLLWVSPARSALLQRWVHGAPDLAVEVLSPSSRRTDELRKRRRYELFGVTELWIVDPDVEVVRVYRRPPGAEVFERPVQLAAERSDLLTTPMLPSLSLPVASLFAG
jgi:Uma2 family endonuclease